MYNYYTPQLGSFSSLVKKAASIADPRNAISQAKRTISTGVEITKDAGKLAVDSTRRAITNPTGIVDNVIADVNQAVGVTAKALTKPVTDEIMNVKKDFYSGGAYQTAQREAAAKAAAQAAEKARKEAEEKQAQQEAAKKATAEQDAARARAAAEQARKSAAYINAKTIEQNENNAVNVANQIENADSQGTQQIRDSAAMAQNSAATSEQMQYLPEVKVKSDFTKYLLIGGGVLLLAYILKGDGRKK